MKNLKSLIIVAISFVLCGFIYSNVDATSSCPSAHISCGPVSRTESRIEVIACLSGCNQLNDEFRFYFKHSEGSWQYVLLTLNIPHDCASPCNCYTCAIDVPCNVEYEWEIRCNNNQVILAWYNEGYEAIYCPCLIGE
jgi:hypothetical protein